MIQIIAIGGEPATGKTTLMRSLMKGFGPGKEFKFKSLRGLQFDSQKVFVLGVYNEDLFAGTDRLSMTVITDARLFLQSIGVDMKWNEWTVIYEGDRLFNQKFFETCESYDKHTIFVLLANDAQKVYRHALRNNVQAEKWLRSRATKIKNLLFDVSKIVQLPNDSMEDLQENIKRILRELNEFRVLK